MTTQQRGEETRTRILDAALEAFGRYGYDATSVSQICRSAGVTKGGFYHHFSSKQAVFLELLERWLKGIDSGLELLRSGAETVPEELFQMSAMVRQVFQDAGGKLTIFMEFMSKAGQSPAVWQMTVAPFRRYQAFLAHLIEKGIAEGSLRPVDPNLATHVLISFALGLLAQGLLDPQGADWGQVTQAGVRMLLEGLERKE
jgi:AcrR family transcriptional regulator